MQSELTTIVREAWLLYGALPCRVTIVRDKVTWTSKGVAFVLFVKREDAHKAVRAMNRKEVSTYMCLCIPVHQFSRSFLVAPSNAAWLLTTVAPESSLRGKTTRTKQNVMNVE